MGVWAERNSTAQLLFHPFRFQTLHNDWSLYSFSGFSRQTRTKTFNHDIICTSARRRGWPHSFSNGTLWLFCHCTVSPLKPSNLPNVCGWVQGLSQSKKKNLQLLIKFCLLFRVFFFFQFVRLPFFFSAWKTSIITLIAIQAIGRLAESKIRNQDVAKWSHI